MVTATLIWIAESGRLREPLEYCHRFGEIVHFQTALKFAYLKAMSYQFCCMVQALGKSSNQLPPNFKSLWTVAAEAFFTFIGPILYLIWIFCKWRICRLAMQWNPLNGIGRKKGRPCETWWRTVERECKNLNKTWPDLKQLAQSRVR